MSYIFILSICQNVYLHMYAVPVEAWRGCCHLDLELQIVTSFFLSGKSKSNKMIEGKNTLCCSQCSSYSKLNAKQTPPHSRLFLCKRCPQLLLGRGLFMVTQKQTFPISRLSHSDDLGVSSSFPALQIQRLGRVTGDHDWDFQGLSLHWIFTPKLTHTQGQITMSWIIEER